MEIDEQSTLSMTLKSLVGWLQESNSKYDALEEEQRLLKTLYPPQALQKLVQYYKGELTENALLNKAATLAAKKDLVLKSNLPAGIVNTKVKPLLREVHHLTKRVRHRLVGGFGGRIKDENDNGLVTGPMEQWLKK